MLKTIVVKEFEYRSAFGKAVFRNVPVSVDAKVSQRSFDPRQDDYALAGDVIAQLERETVKMWLQIQLETLRRPEVKEMRLKGNLVYGICVFLGVNATQFARLLGLSKGTISKVFAGDLPLKGPASRLCLMLLAREAQEPGYVQRVIAAGIPPALDVPAPQMDFKRVEKRVALA